MAGLFESLGSIFGPKEQKPPSRLLPERSYLYYKYPQKSSDYSVEIYFPFFENIEISESQRPNLGTYDLLGRAGNLYSYHGARSREFNLKFYITLPHVLEYVSNYGINEQFTDSFRYFSSDRDLAKRSFFMREERGFEFGKTIGGINRLRGSTNIKKGNQNKDLYYNESLKRFSSLLPPKTELEQLIEELNNLGRNTFKIPVIESIPQLLSLFKPVKERPVVIRNGISYFMFLINVIRTSTLNNSKNTSLSPPTIYINHGTMYNNIPCVCTNYSMRLVSENGYDLKTMNPRRVEVNINLSENRTGNFGAFIPFKYIDGENLAGWEALMEERTMDPWNGTFGDYDSDLRALDAYEKENGELQFDSDEPIGPEVAPDFYSVPALNNIETEKREIQSAKVQDSFILEEARLSEGRSSENPSDPATGAAAGDGIPDSLETSEAKIDLPKVGDDSVNVGLMVEYAEKRRAYEDANYEYIEKAARLDASRPLVGPSDYAEPIGPSVAQPYDRGDNPQFSPGVLRPLPGFYTTDEQQNIIPLTPRGD